MDFFFRNTVYVKIFEVENFHRFCRSPFTYENFHLDPAIMLIISYSYENFPPNLAIVVHLRKFSTSKLFTHTVHTYMVHMYI